jgi:putative ABC transport system substrate-binding protein
MSRPGGNITGSSFFVADLGPKTLGLLHELVPKATMVALLVNPKSPEAEHQPAELQRAARALGLEVEILTASSAQEIDQAFVVLTERRAGALVVGADPFFYHRLDQLAATIVQSRAGALLVGNSILFNNRRRQLAALAARHGVPAISPIREFVLAGGLMSYGARDTDAYRRAGSHYVAPILRGTKPGDLPVEQPTKYELVISVVAAKALGLEIPDKLLALADEVIE